MFDKCIQILKKSWPQDFNSSRKRKKEQPKSSQTNPRGSRKRGKPLRKEDIEVRQNRNNQASLLTCDLGVFFSSLAFYQIDLRHCVCNQKVLKLSPDVKLDLVLPWDSIFSLTFQPPGSSLPNFVICDRNMLIDLPHCCL